MPIRNRAADAGIFEPSEVEMLGRVYEQLKSDGQSLDARGVLASRIIAATARPVAWNLSRPPPLSRHEHARHQLRRPMACK
jgi:hypothetical protein